MLRLRSSVSSVGAVRGVFWPAHIRCTLGVRRWGVWSAWWGLVAFVPCVPVLLD